jgi:hypothetical protein
VQGWENCPARHGRPASFLGQLVGETCEAPDSCASKVPLDSGHYGSRQWRGGTRFGAIRQLLFAREQPFQRFTKFLTNREQDFRPDFAASANTNLVNKIGLRPIESSQAPVEAGRQDAGATKFS